MSTSTSRQARSARREALKSKLEACNIGTRKINPGKVTKKPLKTKSSQSKAELQTALDEAQRGQAEWEQAQPEQTEPEVSASTEPESEVPVPASIEKPIATETLTDAVPEEGPAALSDATTSTQPYSLPINDNATDDELQAYLREFEETSLGSCDVPAPSDSIDVPVARDVEQDKDIFDTKLPGIDLEDEYNMPAYNSSVPALDSSDSPTSPEMMPTTPQEPEPKELGIEDYINYANDTDNEPFEVESKPRSKRAFVCLYGTQPFTQPFHCSFNPNKRTLLAAWRTMAPDYLTGPREAYIQSVLLAAASLNQRSMLSGCARQTMSPGLSTSY